MSASAPSGSPSDRNLLFGILAVQMDFIGRDALIEAMHAWVLDKSVPLGQILHERGHLTSERLRLLEAMVAEHLKAHHDDAQESLVAALVSSDVQRSTDRQSMLDQLKKVGDEELCASLAHMPSAAETQDDSRNVDAVTAIAVPGMRYRIVRAHAKGGLGEVYVAEDADLRREVALKEIRKEHAADAACRGRFILEAQITGALEHPGVVPVYGLGFHDDGRPYYVMRFVKGDNLKKAIQSFHDADQPPLTVAERNLAFRQLLGRFIDVCNAIAYAHSRGVLHRDLKPGNIMLGKYGETLVVDWGLAKSVTRADSERYSDELSLRPKSAGGSQTPTLMGSAVGTPAYMSPEQASGRLDELGPASDVYSLGATLYTLLTGQVPFSGERPTDVLPKVERGEFAPPRAVRTEVSPALEAICLKAMALRPHHRYASALVLAQDIEHWLADEPVSAWPEPATIRLGRWVRRHKPLVAGAAAALFVGLTSLAAGLVWHQHERAEQAAQQARRELEAAQKMALTEQAVRLALDQARTVRDDLQQRLNEPGGVFALLNEPARWQGIIKDARSSIDRAEALIARAEGPMDDALHVDAAALRKLVAADDGDSRLAQALEKIRLDRSTWSKRGFDNSGAVRDYPQSFVAAGFDIVDGDAERTAERMRNSPIKEQLVAALDDWALVTALRGKRDETRALLDRLLLVIRLADPDSWRNQLRDPKLWRDRQLLQDLAESAPIATLSPQIIVLVGMLLRDHDLDAESWLRRGQLLHPSDFWINFNLARLVWDADKIEEAEAFYRAVLAVRPQSSAACTNLGRILQDQGKNADAETAYRKALALEPANAVTWLNLGTIYSGRNDETNAIAAFQKALELDSRYLKASLNLGASLRHVRRFGEAETVYRAAIHVDPKSIDVYLGLGDALNRQKKFDDAAATYRRAIELEPDNWAPHNGLGIVFYDQKKLPEAGDAFRKALELDPNSAWTWTNLGNVLSKQNQAIEAEKAYRKATAIDAKNARAYTGLGKVLDAQSRLDDALAAFRQATEAEPAFADGWNSLGIVLAKLNKRAEALAAYKKALALDSSSANTWSNMGACLYDQRKYAEAIAALKKAVECDPLDAVAWHNLGENFSRKKNLPEAESAYKKSIDIDPKFVSPWVGIGNVYLSRDKFVEAAAAYRKVIELEPKSTMGHYNLGLALQNQLDFATALEHFRKSLELQPPRSGARDKVARRVKLCEEQLALHQKLPRILDGTLQAKDAAEQLGLAQLCLRYTKQYRAAAGFFAAAFDKNPQLGNPLQYKHCYDGACAAARAASGTGADAAKLDDQQRAALRRQALAWLNANLAVWKTEMDRGNVAAILQAQDRVLPLWQEDTALAALRDEPDLARLSKEEQQGCRQFWSAVQQALVQARSHFTESTRSGSLTAEMREAHHPWKMTAGKTYVIDLKSTEFDTFLRLHDEHGVKLAENDDVDPGRDTNSRLIFTPKQDGTYQIIATSFERQEYGAYEIVVREFRKRAQ